ncbi:TlpA family protein disulfide reductase [Streptomyces jumonjinensis]|uniref:TlpA family protein disulfide reductase n=1 Tax=Streptomyces jumonjinensis TaxID=1945 RepID=UPI00379E6122
MPILIALVVLVGLLCILDLILTVGVIKRLREHSEQLARLGRGPLAALTEGDEVPAFETTTTEGDRLSRDELADGTVVAFFTPDCAACQEKKPMFLEYARTAPGGPSEVVAVVVGQPEETAAYAAELAPVAQVVTEDMGGPMSLAFAVLGFPAVLQVARDTHGILVVATDHPDLDRTGTATATAVSA